MADSETILVSCPQCEAAYELTVADVGQDVECACGHQFVVPEPAEPEPSPSTEVMVLCPACALVYQLEPEALGENVECQCGTIFVATEASLPETVASDEVVNPHESVIQTLCPQCSAEYELEATAIGEQVECGCGSQFVVTVAAPNTEDGAAPEQSNPEAEPAESSAPPKRESGDLYREKLAANKQKKSSAPLMVMGGCGVAAVGVLLAFMFAGDSPQKPVKNTVASQKKTKKNEAKPATPEPIFQPVEEPRVSLAERLKQARPQEETGQQTDASPANSEQGDNPANGQVAAIDRPVTTAEMTDNPNSLTGQKDFVIGSPSAGSATAGSRPKNAPDKPDRSLPPESPTATLKTKEKVASNSATPDNGTGDSPPATAASPERKLIPFVTPRRTYRRFKDAATAGFKLFASMREKKAAANGGPTADQKAWQDELANTGGLLKTALRLVDEDSDPQQVLQARLILAFCYLEAGHVYEAGILAHAIARWTPADFVIESESKKDPKRPKEKTKKPADRELSAGEAILAAENAAAEEAAKGALEATVDPGAPTRPALEAASLALAAFVQAYQAAPEDHRGGDFEQIIEVAELFESKFPEHEKLDSIRLYAGDLYQTHEDRVGAADWYARVSKASPNFARSRLQAGQILWSNFLEAKQQAADSKPSNEKTDRLKKRALDYLSAGVNAGGGDDALFSNVVVARLTLAQSHLEEERFEQSVTVLTSKPSSVTSAIGEGSEDRPTVGIRSLAFARLAYTTLIKAHLGAKQLDQARSAMTALSEIAGEDDPAALAQLHLELSSEMTVSYTKLAAEGQDDIELLTTIAASLEQVSAHAKSLSAAKLIKAAETANNLADSVSVQDDAQVIYGQAAALYQAILDVEQTDPGNAKAIRFRLAAAFGKAGKFEESLALYNELLTEQPNIFDAQFAAAQTMQAWGESQNSPDQLARAIAGDSEKPSVWGWARLSLTYQRLLAKDESNEKYRELFLETRLHIAECRLAYARQLSGSKSAKKKTAELEKAMRELATMARTSSSFGAPTWQLLDKIYRDIQQELSRTPEPLFAPPSIQVLPPN